METIYVIRSRDPLDMEGSPDIAAVFADKELATEAVEQLTNRMEKAATKVYGEQWHKFAIEYEVEEWPVSTSAEEAIRNLWGEPTESP